MNKPSKPTFIRAVLTVKNAQYLHPHYIRITLTGQDVPSFETATVGANNKIFLPAPGENDIHFDPPRAIRRTYTHRGIDLVKNEMFIDFVAHGDTGPASAWAMQAKPGDSLGVAMQGTSSPLYPNVDWYLLVADATGIPVLAAILESLPPTAKGIAFIEVLNEQEEIPLTTLADIQINWIYNDSPGETSPLVAAVQNVELPDVNQCSHFGYVAAEFSTVNGIRHFLRKEKAWGKDSLYAYSYWKHGKSEDGSVNERQEEKRSLDLRPEQSEPLS